MIFLWLAGITESSKGDLTPWIPFSASSAQVPSTQDPG